MRCSPRRAWRRRRWSWCQARRSATTTGWSSCSRIAESKGIIAIDGNRIHFAHPLLARGVYTEAAPGQRRTMHRRLADIVDEPELRARHLALAATSGDHVTLRALDTAAESARMRGAPAAAAELMDLAIGLGGDTARSSTPFRPAPFRRRRPGAGARRARRDHRAAGARRPARRSVEPARRRAAVRRRLLRGVRDCCSAR